MAALQAHITGNETIFTTTKKIQMAVHPSASEPEVEAMQEYEYDFVDPLPDEYTCSVCLDVLREPHLTTCCGRHFCKGCILRVQEYGKPCPLCNQHEFLAVIDKSVERRILAMKVRCPFRALGCNWVGEMRHQPDHLDFEKGQCEHRHIKCPNGCEELVPKAELESHLADSCSKRKPFCE